MTKSYDRAYFDRWYRSRTAVVRPDVTARKARLALAAAEHMLGAEVRTVLDVGCGEAQWRGLLRRMRPRVLYVGVDSSAYVVRRYGRRRGIVHGEFGALERAGLRGRFDLVVCADMLQYVPRSELRAGLGQIRRLTGGLAWLEAFATEDDMVGDGERWYHRSAAAYRREFRRAGFVACGLHCYIPDTLRHAANALELVAAPARRRA